MQEGHTSEEHTLDGVTSDGHSVMSDGTLAAAESPAGANRKKSPSRAKELGARILVFTVQAFAVWQAVALLLLAFVPDFVYAVARVLNVTNIPSYPTLLSFFLLTFLSLGLLRRQRAALWLSVAMWQVSMIVALAVATVLSHIDSDSSERFRPHGWHFLASLAFALFVVASAFWMRSAFPARLAPGALRRACLVIALGFATSAGFAFFALETAGFGRLPFRQAVNWSVSVALGLPPDQRPFRSPIEGPYWVETASGVISVATLVLAIVVFLRAAPQNAQRDYDDELAVRRRLVAAGSAD